MTELNWEGKYKDGKKIAPVRIALPFQTIETINESAADSFSRAQILQIIEGEVKRLPGRQREAFLLRYWEELDVAETAQAMGCSEGSVKTHCSRAVHSLALSLRSKGVLP